MEGFTFLEEQMLISPKLAWIEQEEELTAAAMTVRAQELSPDNMDALSWPTFAPRVDVDSTEINELGEIDDRPVASRREWDARGRLIPLETPTEHRIEFIPIESRDAIREKEINKLSTEVRGNQDLFRNVIGSRIPARVDRLAKANLRRIEVDYISGWTMGYVDQDNPETGGTVRFSFQFDASRYWTAPTPWGDPSVNAYDEFVAWYQAGLDAVGGGAEGVRLRRPRLLEIQRDAPPLEGGVKMTRAQLEQRVSGDLGGGEGGFRFFLDEESLDLFPDGGTLKVRTKRWPIDRIALVPTGLQVASTAFAPVVRAQDLVAEIGDQAGIDVRGNTVYYDEQNGGRGLTMEVQLNAFPVPHEHRVWVADVA